MRARPKREAERQVTETERDPPLKPDAPGVILSAMDGGLPVETGERLPVVVRRELGPLREPEPAKPPEPTDVRFRRVFTGNDFRWGLQRFVDHFQWYGLIAMAVLLTIAGAWKLLDNLHRGY